MNVLMVGIVMVYLIIVCHAIKIVRLVMVLINVYFVLLILIEKKIYVFVSKDFLRKVKSSVDHVKEIVHPA